MRAMSEKYGGFTCHRSGFVSKRTAAAVFVAERMSTWRPATKRAAARTRFSDQAYQLADLLRAAAREIKINGKQNAHRRHAPGGNSGGGAARQSG
jgi:hypothetical protein